MTWRDGDTLADWRARCDDIAARQEAAPNFVYRAFDSYGLLLYIGCSLDVEKRLSTHRREARWWWQYAETIGISGPYRRSEAMALEREAIETERPAFNSSMANHRLLQRKGGHPLATTEADRLDLYLAARADARAATEERAA